MQEFVDTLFILLLGMALSWVTSFAASYIQAMIIKKDLEKRNRLTKRKFSAMVDFANSGCCLGPLVFLVILKILTTEQVAAKLDISLAVIWLFGTLLATYLGTMLVKMQT
ncbi:MAG: hypothetical protein DRO73_09795 [Candidatus Thorarchaeota archaeon]|nr:MAG: hypothetical protein DRO73_09795 [Candidatus Thorarchaeota archaeon]